MRGAGLFFLVLVGLVAWAWFLPVTTGSHAINSVGFECTPGAGPIESFQQLIRNLTRGVALIVIGIGIIWAAIRAAFESGRGAFERVESIGDVGEGFESIVAGFAIIGGAFACVATFGAAACNTSSLPEAQQGVSPAPTQLIQSEPQPTASPQAAEEAPPSEASNCSDLIRQAQFAFGDDWRNHLSTSDLAACSAQTDPRQPPAPRLYGSAYCGYLIQDMRNKYGDEWRAGFSSEDAAGCAPQIEMATENTGPTSTSPSGPSDASSSLPFNQNDARPLPETSDSTYCLNVIAKARAHAGDRWMQELSSVDSNTCEQEIREQRRRDGF